MLRTPFKTVKFKIDCHVALRAPRNDVNCLCRGLLAMTIAARRPLAESKGGESVIASVAKQSIVLALRKLRLPQRVIGTAFFHQLGRRTAFYNATFIDYKNAVGILNR